MKSAQDIALKARLASLSGTPKAWPNEVFDPAAPGNMPYIACTVVRAGTTDETVDGTAPVVVGRLIATVVVEAGTGEIKADTIAAQIAALFPMGLRIPAGAQSICIMQPPHIREGMPDGAYWRVPVSIPFQIM